MTWPYHPTMKGGELSMNRFFKTAVPILMLSFVMASIGYAKVPTTKEDHLSIAKKYETMATDEEKLIQEHTDMKKDYKANQASLPKQNREKALMEMEEHCDAIINEAKKLSTEYRAIAQWHKLRAEELKQ